MFFEFSVIPLGLVQPCKTPNSVLSLLQIEPWPALLFESERE